MHICNTYVQHVVRVVSLTFYLSLETGLHSLQPPGGSRLLFLWRHPAGVRDSGKLTHSWVFPSALPLSHRHERGEEWEWVRERGGWEVVKLRALTPGYFHQESWFIRLSLQTRALWWRRPETSALCFARERPARSPPQRWDDPSPTLCSLYWTSTTYARGCPSLARIIIKQIIFSPKKIRKRFGLHFEKRKKQVQILLIQLSVLI